MPRLRHIRSGAVVSTSKETAARLGAEWVDADEAPAVEKAPTRRASKKASSTASSDES